VLVLDMNSVVEAVVKIDYLRAAALAIAALVVSACASTTIIRPNISHVSPQKSVITGVTRDASTSFTIHCVKSGNVGVSISGSEEEACKSDALQFLAAVSKAVADKFSADRSAADSAAAPVSLVLIPQRMGIGVNNAGRRDFVLEARLTGNGGSVLWSEILEDLESVGDRSSADDTRVEDSASRVHEKLRADLMAAGLL
jgi:hypothetical protein